jgi:hypothetical protein
MAHTLLGLLDTFRLDGLAVRVCHLSVLRLDRLLSSLLSLFFLLTRLSFGTSLGCLLLLDLEAGLALFFLLVIVSLNDRTSDKSDLLHLGHVLSLASILAVFVQPVLL